MALLQLNYLSKTIGAHHSLNVILPEDESFSRSFQELVLAEAGQSRDAWKQVRDGDKSSGSSHCATRGVYDNQPISDYAEASSGYSRLGSEPSYVITEMTGCSWDSLLFSSQEVDGTEVERNHGVDSPRYPWSDQQI